jgi:hypothetical protein
MNWEGMESLYRRNFKGCKEFALGVSLDKCMVMKLRWKTGDVEKIKYNNHKIKQVRKCTHNIIILARLPNFDLCEWSELCQSCLGFDLCVGKVSGACLAM